MQRKKTERKVQQRAYKAKSGHRRRREDLRLKNFGVKERGEPGVAFEHATEANRGVHRGQGKREMCDYT